VKTTKTGIYKKWKERSHRQISLGGRAIKDISEEGTARAGILSYLLLPVKFYLYDTC